MKNFNVLGVYGKIGVLEGGCLKNQYIGEDCLKKGGGLGQFEDLRGGGGGGGLARKRRLVFLGGVETPIHAMIANSIQSNQL